MVTSFGVALVELSSPAMLLSVRLITGWRGAPRNTAAEEHDEIGWFTADQLRMLQLADARYTPLLTSLLRPTPSVQIRRIDEEAWESIGALHALSQHETYTSLLPGRPRVRFRPVDLVEHWRTRPNRAALVLHGGWMDENLVGFVATSPVAAQRFELNALHVRPDWHGRGLGEWLHRAALAHVRGQGGHECRLWVVAGNLRARRFYEKHGWRVSKGHRTVSLAGAAQLPAIEYTRTV